MCAQRNEARTVTAVIVNWIEFFFLKIYSKELKKNKHQTEEVSVWPEGGKE